MPVTFKKYDEPEPLSLESQAEMKRRRE